MVKYCKMINIMQGFGLIFVVCHTKYVQKELAPVGRGHQLSFSSMETLESSAALPKMTGWRIVKYLKKSGT